MKKRKVRTANNWQSPVRKAFYNSGTCGASTNAWQRWNWIGNEVISYSERREGKRPFSLLHEIAGIHPPRFWSNKFRVSSLTASG
jgi:hypothetical protein